MTISILIKMNFIVSNLENLIRILKLIKNNILNSIKVIESIYTRGTKTKSSKTN